MLGDEGRAYAARSRDESVSVDEVSYPGQPTGSSTLDFPLPTSPSRTSAHGFSASSPQGVMTKSPIWWLNLRLINPSAQESVEWRGQFRPARNGISSRAVMGTLTAQRLVEGCLLLQRPDLS